MVQSKIDPTIHYEEHKKVADIDKNMAVSMYEMEILPSNVPIIFVLGKRRTRYPEQTVHWPMYLVTKKKHMVPIGVFEIRRDKESHVLDSNNNIDVEKLSDPLLFTWATAEYLKRKALTMDEYMKDSTKSMVTADTRPPSTDENMPPELKELYQTIPVDLRNTFDYTPVHIIPLLQSESKQDDDKIIAKYRQNPPAHPNLIQKFMENANYHIIDTVADGNCFFDAITKAFATIGHQTTPAKLRALLANAATDAVFERYKEFYNATHNAKTQHGGDVKRLAGEYNMIKSRMENTLDRNDRIQLYKSGQQVAGAYEQTKQIKKVVDNVANEFAFMSGVNTLDEFKKKLQTTAYWADEWGIEHLQRLLQIKVIILSDICANTPICVICDNNSKLDNADRFIPRFYIIVEYSGGNHYRLVSYKSKSIFQFSELPNGLKANIFKSCRMNGRGVTSLYASIPDFKPIANRKKEDAAAAASAAAILNITHNNNDPNLILMIGMCMNDPHIGQKQDDVIPVNIRVETEYAKLVTHKVWRKQLSADWSKTSISGRSDDPWLFILDNLQWASVEHYVQAAKFKKNARNFYALFSLTSRKDDDKDTIAMNVKKARAAGSNSGEYTTRDKSGKEIGKEQLRPTNIKIDPNYKKDDEEEALLIATRAKYAQNPDLAAILLLTKNATLKNGCQKGDAKNATALMKVRDELANRNQNRL